MEAHEAKPHDSADYHGSVMRACSERGPKDTGTAKESGLWARPPGKLIK